MRALLLDLYQHQAWADAELWRAYEAHPGALADPPLWTRLHELGGVPPLSDDIVWRWKGRAAPQWT